MSPINDSIKREMAEVKALFKEDLELRLYNLRNTYCEFLVTSVDGQKTNHRIVVDFYDTQIYCDPKNRDPWKQLSVSDLDVRVRYGQVGNHANKVINVLNEGHTLSECSHAPYSRMEVNRPEEGLYAEHGAKLSIRAMLEEAYKLGGYGAYPDRKNSNGVTTTDARAIADEAIGPLERKQSMEAKESYTLRDVADKVADLEDLLAGRIGEEDLINELEEAFDEIKGALSAAMQQNSILDPKGHVVLAEFGNDALMFTRLNVVEPYVVAHNYDKKTGEWSHGSYYSDLSDAWDAANPEILENSVVKWQRVDLQRALEEQGVVPSERDVNELAWLTRNMKWWKDRAIEDGNEYLSDEAYNLSEDLSESLKKDERHSSRKPDEMKSRAADYVRSVKTDDGLDQGNSLRH